MERSHVATKLLVTHSVMEVKELHYIEGLPLAHNYLGQSSPNENFCMTLSHQQLIDLEI